MGEEITTEHTYLKFINLKKLKESREKMEIKEYVSVAALILLAVGCGLATAVIFNTFYGGQITVVGNVAGQVLYSYDNKSWAYKDITVNKSKSESKSVLFVAFNTTFIPESGHYNFTFYLNETIYLNETKIDSKIVDIDSVPMMVYCSEILDTELFVGKQYQVRVEVYK